MESTLAETNRAKTRRLERLEDVRSAWELEGYILRLEVNLLPERKLSPYAWAYVPDSNLFATL